MSQQQEYWFAARTRKDQELTTRDALEKIGVEYFCRPNLSFVN